MDTKKGKKGKKTNCYHCDVCDFKCYKKYAWERHIETIKHQKKTVTQVTILTKSDHILATDSGFECAHCRKYYKTKSGLYRHVKKCVAYHKKSSKNNTFLPQKKGQSVNFDGNNGNNGNFDNDEKNVTQLLWDIIKEKDKILEEKEKMLDMQTKHVENVIKAIENGSQGMGHHNTINSNNTTNNNITVNMFLTEHCKDAMFLDDFVNNIKVKLNDVLKGGLLEDNAITNVVVQQLEDLEPTKRPIHCTDTKRKKFVVNDKKEGWVKDSLSDSNSKLKSNLETMQTKAFIDVYDEFDEKYKPPHEDALERKKSKLVGSLRDPLVSGKGTERIMKSVAEVANIKDAIKSIKQV